jgi:hypothetical protein
MKWNSSAVSIDGSKMNEFHHGMEGACRRPRASMGVAKSQSAKEKGTRDGKSIV